MERTRGMAVAALALLLASGCTDPDETLDEFGPPVEPSELEVGVDPTILEVDTLEGAGPYLTDAMGLSLYLLEGEPEGESTCYDACAGEWPPFLAPGGPPRAGADPVEEELIGTFRRRDGTIQVTYGGHPLYYYHEDAGPAEAVGHDVHDQWGGWYLVSPSGEALED